LRACQIGPYSDRFLVEQVLDAGARIMRERE
jgi:hypothetical protein